MRTSSATAYSTGKPAIACFTSIACPNATSREPARPLPQYRRPGRGAAPPRPGSAHAARQWHRAAIPPTRRRPQRGSATRRTETSTRPSSKTGRTRTKDATTSQAPASSIRATRCTTKRETPGGGTTNKPATRSGPARNRCCSPYPECLGDRTSTTDSSACSNTCRHCSSRTPEVLEDYTRAKQLCRMHASRDAPSSRKASSKTS